MDGSHRPEQSMKKILIVEDDQLVATAYKKRFLEAGYEVELAPDGLEGIKMVASVKPDVVLLDLLMPRLDGIEVLKYIRSHPDLKYLPVVVFSNSYMTNLVENAWRAGADQCLMKASTTPAQLFDTVNKAIQKAQARATAPVTARSLSPVNPLSRGAASESLAPRSAQAASAGSTARPGPGALGPSQLVTPLPAGSAPPGFVAPPPSPSDRTAKSPGAGVDPEFQAQIRALFLNSSTAKVAAVRDAATAFVHDQGSSMQIPLLADLFRKVHSLTGNAAVSGCASIAHYASTFEALLQELQQKPKFINISTARTVIQAVEFLDILFQQAASPITPPPPSPVLVVDADSMSGQAITMALENAGYQTVVLTDPGEALGRIATEPFSAIIVEAALPGMTGFEWHAQMQSLPSNGNLPILFVTPLNDFPAHSNPEVLGNNDLIGKPFLLIEMTLKAVTQVEWSLLSRATS